MKNIIIAITLGLTLTACGSDTPPEKEITTKELAAAAAAGDKDALRELERKAAKAAKAEREKMAAAAKTGDPLAAFQKRSHPVKAIKTASTLWPKPAIPMHSFGTP